MCSVQRGSFYPIRQADNSLLEVGTGKHSTVSDSIGLTDQRASKARTNGQRIRPTYSKYSPTLEHTISQLRNDGPLSKWILLSEDGNADFWTFRLLVPRWYPSAMIMANGSIVVVGGEIGNNEATQPNLEILPKTGGGIVNLPFLQATAPFNLYPYIMVVPSGIFILYYNEARILNEKTFATIKTLPNVPGAVNDPTGGRSYQLQGTTVAMPQYAPFTDPIGIMACGGSTQGGGYAIDNCASTQPEATNPTWTIERMVNHGHHEPAFLRTPTNINVSPQEESCLPWRVSPTVPISFVTEASTA